MKARFAFKILLCSSKLSSQVDNVGHDIVIQST